MLNINFHYISLSKSTINIPMSDALNRNGPTGKDLQRRMERKCNRRCRKAGGNCGGIWEIFARRKIMFYHFNATKSILRATRNTAHHLSDKSFIHLSERNSLIVKSIGGRNCWNILNQESMAFSAMSTIQWGDSLMNFKIKGIFCFFD